ncbi:Stk1 family PASTA domain-containing Ser/Thr kinase [Knoellia sp. p5-6-4]|uniref:Stk1 family PASTA domain-containing Ser/Thr kinase n=1 Tax=unclassified Knoellia TaxID=2618719 RepID=UPI0023DB65C3|nr:Stk1 family PASTA domain-containing Ser/Thr kinase [Knoellia sp. p5-6-4]MDF2143627.1 Stk1 family PASTA domain-containing Ser/Thr kinase [Knoellia sp. p5-6-4]
MSSGVTESLVGRVLDGRYRVLSHIADGGMATVYLALDTRLDREVALKVMRPGLAADETFVSRFRREARSAARLSHPNVVAVFDQGEDEGSMFLAMEYVPGQTLREVMQAEGPLTPRAALDFLDPMLQALASAHRAGIIHRDVKPENVILREDGTVKVADFGLARAVTTQTTAAQTGMLLGTVAYLSPEQVERGIADARSDVYAAGLILFEMLTGTKAFTGDTPIHVAYQHVHGSVPSPSSRVPDVPAELDALVALATSRDPDQRPADADAFLAEVRRIRGALSPTELDHRPEGPAAVAAGANTVPVARTTALPLGAVGARPAGADAAPTAVVARGEDTKASTRDGAAGKGPWRWALAALLLLAAVSAGLWYFTMGPGSPTVVPVVAGKTYEQAQRELTAAHLNAERVDAFDEKVAKGRVISGNPGPGAEVGRSTTVTLTVSKGPERYTVPELVGSTQTEAKARLAENRLALGATSEAFDEKVPAGQIISTAPKAGTALKRGAAVSIVVSKGRQPIEVQDFTGKPADQAVATLTDAGLQVDATKQEFSTDVPKGSVISQSPASGTLFRGGTVVLVVSKGPEMVKVPNVQGKQLGEARTILEGAGFQVKVESFMGGIFGTVRSQSPAADAEAPKGSVVTLVVV